MGITLDKEHGLNPSICKCPICGKDNGIALLGHIKNGEKAPHHIIGDVCDECVKKASPDKVYIVSIDSDGKIKAYALVYKTAINVPVKGVMIFMRCDEFNEVFNITR